MSFSRPIQWYHSHADPIWPDGTFKSRIWIRNKIFIHNSSCTQARVDSERDERGDKRDGQSHRHSVPHVQRQVRQYQQPLLIYLFLTLLEDVLFTFLSILNPF